ncbi:putative VWFA domain-containing protein [Seiridium cardinale]
MARPRRPHNVAQPQIQAAEKPSVEVATSNAPEVATSSAPEVAISSAPEVEMQLETQPEMELAPEEEVKLEASPAPEIAPTTSRRKQTSKTDRTSRKSQALDMKVLELADQLTTERQTCDELRKRIAELEEELQALKATSKATEAQLQDQVASLQDELTKTREAEAVMRAQHDKKSKAYESTIKSLNGGLQAKTDVEKVRDTARARLQRDHDEKLRRAEADIKRMNSQYIGLKREYNDLKEEHDLLEEIEKTVQDREVQYKRKITALDSKCDKAVAELEQTRHDKEKLEQSFAKRTEAMQFSIDAKTREIKTIQNNKKAVEQREKSLVAERDSALIIAQQLETQCIALKESTRPIDRLVVVCVDASGSVGSVLYQVKQVYRDIILYLKAKCSDAKIAVIIHGDRYNRTHNAEPVSERTLSWMDNTGTPNTEDYAYCLSEAQRIFALDTTSRKVVVMIGDGNGKYDDSGRLNLGLAFLRDNRIPAHSVIIPNGTTQYFGYTMMNISGETGGRVESKDTYFSALTDFVGGD